MKKKFRGYYKPTSEGFEALWNEALIVLDANVLLNLYTYSTETWQEFLQLVREMKDRVWLPYQAAAEYHRNRCGIISKEAKRYGEILRDLRSVRDALGARKRHPFIGADLLKQFNELSSTIEESLTAGQAAQTSLIRVDPICDQVTDIFDGLVGEPLSPEELEKVYVEGAERFSKKTPPGYEDEKKPELDRYGDLVLWKEVMRKSCETGKGVILVTDDTKPDWWFIIGEERIGPRPELLEEFHAATGKGLYLYGSDLFVEKARERGKAISERALAELEAAKTAREVRERKRAEEQASRYMLVEYEAQQRALREAMKSPLEAAQRVLREAVESPLEAAQRALREAVESPLEAAQRASREAMRSPLAEYEAQQRALLHDTKDTASDKSVPDDDAPSEDADNHAKEDDDQTE